MRKRGFTLIELLVVIAVVALLTAIAVPTLLAAKNRACSIQCSSNVRQLSIGFVIFQQENEILPYGFSDLGYGTLVPPGGYAGDASYDEQGWWWFDYLRSVIEIDLAPGSTAWCPARKLNIPDVRKNILCGNYGVNRSVCKNGQGEFSGKPLSATQVRMPAETLLISDSGYSLLSWLAATETALPVFENDERIEYFYIPGLALNQSRSELQDNPDAIKGRHPHQTLNVGFADGHNETRPAESLAIEQTITDESRLPSLWNP